MTLDRTPRLKPSVSILPPTPQPCRMGFTNSPSFSPSLSMNSATITVPLIVGAHVRISELVFSFYHLPWNWGVACDTSQIVIAPQTTFRIPRDATILGSCRTLDEPIHTLCHRWCPGQVSSGLCYSLPPQRPYVAHERSESLRAPNFEGMTGWKISAPTGRCAGGPCRLHTYERPATNVASEVRLSPRRLGSPRRRMRMPIGSRLS